MKTIDTSDGRARVMRQTEAFVSALRAAPVTQRFADARRRFETDANVQVLLERYQREADAFQHAQQHGDADAAHVRAIREAQARVQAHPVVREFVEAQEALGTFLLETNAAISETLGMDFGQTAGPAGGAC